MVFMPNKFNPKSIYSAVILHSNIRPGNTLIILPEMFFKIKLVIQYIKSCYFL